MDNLERRRQAVRKSLRKSETGGFLVTDIINVRYLSGFTGSSAFLFITGDRNFFVTDFRYKEQAEREVPGWEIIIEKGNRMEVIENLVRKTTIGSLGFEPTVSYSFYRRLLKTCPILNDTEGLIEKIREIKDASELSKIREAVRRAEKALLEVKPYIREGAVESSIAQRLEGRLKKLGCGRIPFDIIVASGENSAMPHAKTTQRRFHKGDLITIDWGGEAEGYFSDMTRTFLLSGGRDTGRKKEIYRTVLEANRIAISRVSPGIGSKTIDRAARDCIREAGYEEFFGHGTGHGVGLQVHEAPRITWMEGTVLRNGMVFTIEPGIYIPGLGGVRIEDMVVVKNGKVEILTTLPKEIEVL
ncbi:MAG TPA: Xaa-Pro peptidase family protein [Thermodesulfovibrionales bacterium]|nr:Xaa-Pro peptidase family protein [Thermodesulfovibrionales bacterium]